MDLCLECHDDPSALPEGKTPRSVHSPIIDDEECTPCHSPHAGEGAMLLDKVPGLCYQCHDDVTIGKGGLTLASVHTPVADDACFDCHRPHSAPETRLLEERGTKLCMACHDDPSLDDGGHMWQSSHPPVEEGCLNCHSPHGSDAPYNLVEPTFKLCTGCHEEHPAHSLDASRYLEAEEGSMVKLPENFSVTVDGLMVCTGCHLAHGAQNRPLFKVPKDQLCEKCHS
jgi:predicted CXXCH cytochrome family protein